MSRRKANSKFITRTILIANLNFLLKWPHPHSWNVYFLSCFLGVQIVSTIIAWIQICNIYFWLVGPLTIQLPAIINPVYDCPNGIKITLVKGELLQQTVHFNILFLVVFIISEIINSIEFLFFNKSYPRLSRLYSQF